MQFVYFSLHVPTERIEEKIFLLQPSELTSIIFLIIDYMHVDVVCILCVCNCDTGALIAAYG